MALALVTISLFIVFFSPAFAAPFTSSIVNLDYARYQGVQNETLGITTYYGLRYAAPPTSALRWQPPIPIEKSGIYQENPMIDATSPGFQCHQANPSYVNSMPPRTTVALQDFRWLAELAAAAGNAFPGQDPTTAAQSEDCLRLDVIVPSQPASWSLPVVVQIHGGGYTLGSSIGYDGSDFVSYSSGSVIYVQIQYRLGVYGFLQSKELLESGTANAGLLDQRLALEWVRKYISKFGGDPSRVTIWGTSAGGGSVDAQMILYGGEDLPPFQAAIAQYPWWQPYHEDAVLQAQYDDLLNVTKCANINCLRQLTEESLASVQQDVYDIGYSNGRYGYGDFYLGPTVDGVIIRDLPSQEFQAGHFSAIPLLVDHNTNEGLIFTNFSLTQPDQVQPNFQRLWPSADQTFFDRLFELYPESDFTGTYFNNDSIQSFYTSVVPSTYENTVFYQTQTIFGDYIINCPSRYISTASVKASVPVWKMVFQAGTQVHSASVPYLFNNNNATDNPTLAAQMKSYYVSFITGHDPNSVSVPTGDEAKRPEWVQYGNDAQVLYTGDHVFMTASDEDANARCEFFGSQSRTVRNKH